MTQWILSNSYSVQSGYEQGEDISSLIAILEKKVTQNVNAVCEERSGGLLIQLNGNFSPNKEREFINIINYFWETEVNWCPALDVWQTSEIVKEFSEAGASRVVKQ